MKPEIDLSGLRDLHILDQPSFWPLATGWWIVLGTIVFALIVLAYARYLWQQKPSVYAIRKLHKIANNTLDDLDFLKEISHLLKRVAIVIHGRSLIAPLSDTTWQDFLLAQADDLTKKEAHLIAFAPYEQKLTDPVDRTQLVHHCKLWIKKVFKNKKSS